MATLDLSIVTVNLLEEGTLTVTGTPDPGKPESRLHDRDQTLYWLDTVTEAKEFTVDQGAAGSQAIDFLAIAGHNFDGEDLQFQYSTDDFSADINDAVTDWTQSGNATIIKTMSSSQTKRYWRVTLTSMANPQCTEICMGLQYTFDIRRDPNPTLGQIANVKREKLIGGQQRAVRLGPQQGTWLYQLILSSSELTNFRACMDDLDDFSKPFWFKDHTDSWYLVRFSHTNGPKYNHLTNDYTWVLMDLLEMI